MMKYVRSLVFGLLAVSLHAQTPVTVKPSPAVTALTDASKSIVTEQKAYDQGVQQARSTLDASQKQLNDQLTKLLKDLDDQLKVDKKYKPTLDQIATIRTQLNNLGQAAQEKFNTSVGVIGNKLNADKALIGALIPIVRKENDLSDAAVFDTVTQTWTEPKK